MPHELKYKIWRANERKKLIDMRKSLSAEQVHEASYLVHDKFLKLPFLAQPRTIASYMSLNGEIDTHRLNDSLLERKHTLGIPYITPKRGIMHFYTYAHSKELKANRYGILEPEPCEQNYIMPDHIDLVIVPLVGFNRQGDRLGMGGGYYDRMLKKVSANCLTVGLAYDFQYLEDLIGRSWDMPLSMVITPSQIYEF